MERANRRAKELEQQFEADAFRQMIMASKQQSRRKRANSETTEVPTPVSDIPTVTFEDGFLVHGIRYDTVKYFHPRNCTLLHFSVFSQLNYRQIVSASYMLLISSIPRTHQHHWNYMLSLLNPTITLPVKAGRS